MTMVLQKGVTGKAQARPEATALVFKGTRLTYAALEEASNRLARVLKEAGCRRGGRGGLLMPKMPAGIGALLGAPKTHAVYLPLGPARPATPQARGGEMSDPPCRTASRPLVAKLPDH